MMPAAAAGFRSFRTSTDSGSLIHRKMPPLGCQHSAVGTELALDGLDHSVQFVVQHAVQMTQMPVEILREIFRDHHLIESTGAAVAFNGISRRVISHSATM